MATERDIDILKDEMSRQETMKRWRLRYSASTAKALAWRAKVIFEDRLRSLRVSGVSAPNLRELANDAIKLAPKGLSSQNAGNRHKNPSSRKPKAKRRAGAYRSRGAPARSRAMRSTLQEEKKRSIKPLNPRYKPDLRTTTPTDENHRPYRSGRYNPRRVVAASKIETHDYARYIDEGIGGTREAALAERKKLRQELRDRSKKN